MAIPTQIADVRLNNKVRNKIEFEWKNIVK